MKQIYKQLGKVRPTVEGDWSIGKNYTLLSIVYDEVGNASYISRKDVPAGIQITNKEYWTRFSNTRVNSDSIVLLSKIQDDGLINSYDLQEAIDSFKTEDKRLGTFISFYEKPIGESTDYRWNLYQFNSNNIDDWNNTKYWQSIYYIQNKFLGLFSSEESLKRTRPFPIIGDYAFVGATLKEAVVYRCNNIGVWTRTNEKAKDYLSINLKGDITISEEGNWVIDGLDTGISSKGENGKTPLLRIKDYKWQVSYDGGTIYKDIPNSPIFVKEDNEDIVGDLQTDGVKLLKFADKEYNANKFSGLGRVYLRKNIVNGKNVLTQEMINKPNTIYIIQYDYDLDNKQINVPENCTLDFQGGSFKNGIINFNKCNINNNTNKKILDISLNINDFGNQQINVEWFGAKGDDNFNNTNIFNYVIKNFDNIYIPKGIYITDSIIIGNKSNLKIIGDGWYNNISRTNYTILKYTGINYCLDFIENLWYCNIEHLTFVLGECKGGLRVNNIYNCIFDYLAFYNYDFTGIATNNSADAFVIRGSGLSNSLNRIIVNRLNTGIKILRTSTQEWINTTKIGCGKGTIYISNCNYGLHIEKGMMLEINGAVIDTILYDGIYLKGETDFGDTQLILHNCYFEKITRHTFACYSGAEYKKITIFVYNSEFHSCNEIDFAKELNNNSRNKSYIVIKDCFGVPKYENSIYNNIVCDIKYMEPTSAYNLNHYIESLPIESYSKNSKYFRNLSTTTYSLSSYNSNEQSSEINFAISKTIIKTFIFNNKLINIDSKIVIPLFVSNFTRNDHFIYKATIYGYKADSTDTWGGKNLNSVFGITLYSNNTDINYNLNKTEFDKLQIESVKLIYSASYLPVNNYLGLEITRNSQSIELDTDLCLIVELECIGGTPFYQKINNVGKEEVRKLRENINKNYDIIYDITTKQWIEKEANTTIWKNKSGNIIYQ